jgi:hypothetical protein
MGYCSRTHCFIAASSSKPVAGEDVPLVCSFYSKTKINIEMFLSLCCHCHSVTYIDKMTYYNDLLIRVQTDIFGPRGMRDAVLSAHIAESRIITKCSPYAQTSTSCCHIAMICHEAALVRLSACSLNNTNAITTPGCSTLPV